MTAIGRLSGAAYGTHFTDQIALAALPLVVARAFDASLEVIGRRTNWRRCRLRAASYHAARI
jgi:hypothetical protein